MGWTGEGWGGLGRVEVEWGEVLRAEIGSNGGWLGGMGWDGMGWDGMAWRGVVWCLCTPGIGITRLTVLTIEPVGLR